MPCPCPYCPELCTNYNVLIKHVKKEHGKGACPVCGRIFVDLAGHAGCMAAEPKHLLLNGFLNVGGYYSSRNSSRRAHRIAARSAVKDYFSKNFALVEVLP